MRRRRTSPKHRAWSLGAGDAESRIAEARKALFVMAGFLAILWIIQLVNAANHYSLDWSYGIRPRDPGTLGYILTSPFLHVSWTHIESNSGPLFIFGFLAAYRGVVRFLWLTLLLIVVSGLAQWVFGPAHTVGVGASGVVFGYLGYILVRGFFDRHGIDILIGAVMALCFAYQFTVLLPQAGIGWQDHIGGVVAGVFGGWVFRDRTVKAAARGPAASAARQPSASAPTAALAPLPVAAPVAEPVAGRQGATTRVTDAGTGTYSGPRADLHRQLGDVGL